MFTEIQYSIQQKEFRKKFKTNETKEKEEKEKTRERDQFGTKKGYVRSKLINIHST